MVELDLVIAVMRDVSQITAGNNYILVLSKDGRLFQHRFFQVYHDRVEVIDGVNPDKLSGIISKTDRFKTTKSARNIFF